MLNSDGTGCIFEVPFDFTNTDKLTNQNITMNQSQNIIPSKQVEEHCANHYSAHMPVITSVEDLNIIHEKLLIHQVIIGSWKYKSIFNSLQW